MLRYIETLPRIGYRFIGMIDRPEVVRGTCGAGCEPRGFPAALDRHRGSPARGRGGGHVGGDGSARVEAALTVGAGEPTVVARRTTSVRAYEHYLQGIYHRSRRDIDGDELALANFEAAIAEDPEYAVGWAGLADTLTAVGIGHHAPAADAFQRSRAGCPALGRTRSRYRRVAHRARSDLTC